MATNYITLAPGDRAPNPMVIPGTKRTYSCAAGSNIQVPDFDVQAMISAGWVAASATNVNTVSVRPANPTIGTVVLDSTINAMVVYLGPKAGWVHHGTGANA